MEIDNVGAPGAPSPGIFVGSLQHTKEHEKNAFTALVNLKLVYCVNLCEIERALQPLFHGRVVSDPTPVLVLMSMPRDGHKRGTTLHGSEIRQQPSQLTDYELLLSEVVN